MLTPNDEVASAVISYLKTLDTPPRTFPATGQDATPAGLQNILAGYECGTVYKPIYEEAQAAAALILYLRAGITPPRTLVNARTYDPVTRYPGAVRAAQAGLGDGADHGFHRDQGRLRPGGPALRRRPAGRLPRQAGIRD